jgi:hypothetical protein
MGRLYTEAVPAAVNAVGTDVDVDAVVDVDVDEFDVEAASLSPGCENS